jgi:hypothetical protein
MTVTHHTARQIPNRIATVNNLPVELLSDIFCTGLHEYSPTDLRATKYLSAICSICSVWRDVALSTPSLWRNVIYDDDYDVECHRVHRYTKERLSAYLSRSKSCSIRLHLGFGVSSSKLQSIKSIVYPHLPRCHTIRLTVQLARQMNELLPLPGDLCRLATFTCQSLRYEVDKPGGLPLSLFAKPERVSLRKLILRNSPLPLDNINTQNLHEVQLTHLYGLWLDGVTFTRRCHSISTLICDIIFDTDQPFAPFALPSLTYCDVVESILLTAIRMPDLQTLVLRLDAEIQDNAIFPLPSWPALATLCIVHADVHSHQITDFLLSNPNIKRLILVDCVGVDGVIRLLGDGDTGNAADTDRPSLLPSLSLLRICCYQAEEELDHSPVGPLLIRRPKLSIEYDGTCRVGPFAPNEIKSILEAPARVTSLAS